MGLSFWKLLSRLLFEGGEGLNLCVVWFWCQGADFILILSDVCLFVCFVISQMVSFTIETLRIFCLLALLVRDIEVLHGEAGQLGSSLWLGGIGAIRSRFGGVA